MKVHLLGIGGIGVSALARHLHAQGHTVSGSDAAESDITRNVSLSGIQVYPEGAKNITPDIEQIIYSEAIASDHPERLAAHKLGIGEQSYFSALGEVCRDYTTVAIAGTHGKTTTVGLTASALFGAGADPTVFAGSLLPALSGSNYHAGESNLLVVEACEYRENFRFIKPDIALVTNIDYDHPDAFSDEESYRAAFARFLMPAKKIIAFEDEPGIKELLSGYEGELILIPRPKQGEIALSILGQYNVENAALVRELGRILELDESDILTGLKNYTGAWRRQEYLGAVQGVDIYSDYAHHPTEITATIAAFREGFPDRHLAILFEPHQFSRTRVFEDEFIKALKHADTVALRPIYAARDTEWDKAAVSHETLAHKLSACRIIETEKDLNNLIQTLPEGSILMALGAGAIDNFVRGWVKNPS